MRYVFVFSKGATHKLCDRQIMINDIIEGSALQDEELKILTFVFQFLGPSVAWCWCWQCTVYSDTWLLYQYTSTQHTHISTLTFSTYMHRY